MCYCTIQMLKCVLHIHDIYLEAEQLTLPLGTNFMNPIYIRSFSKAVCHISNFVER